MKGEIEKFCGAVISFLQKQLAKQLANLKSNNSKYAEIFTLLLKIATFIDFSKCGDTNNKLFERKK